MQLTRDQVKTILNNAPTGTDKKKVLDGLITRGYEIEGVDTNAAKLDIQSRSQPVAQKEDGAVKEAVGDVTGIISDIGSSATKRSENIDAAQQRFNAGDQGLASTVLQTGGQLAGAGADAIGAAFKGATNIAFSDKTEKSITDVIGRFGAKVMADPNVQGLINKYNELTPEQQANVDATGGIVDLVSNFVGAGVATKAGTVAKQGINAGIDATRAGVNTAIDATTQGAKSLAKTAGTVLESTPVQGAIQTVKDVGGYLQRGAKKGSEAVAEQAAKAKMLKTASPATKDAINSGLDPLLTRTAQSADIPTAKAYDEVMKVAEKAGTTLGKAENPTIVGGNYAAKQYEIIDKAKKKVGKAIGDEVKTLSDTGRVEISDAFDKLNNFLSDAKVTLSRSDDGSIKVGRGSSSLTDAEIAKVQELYNTATESGTAMTASEIRAKDQLFSKLQRQANMEGLSQIIVDTANGPKNIFGAFRDIFSDKLGEISPKLRKLNKQYRELSNYTDDIEGSILKTPNFNITKSLDKAEFAKVNLRRIFGESQSSPIYEGIADSMDKLARKLGYKGPKPKDIADFAETIRKLYPEIVPKTGFQGGIQSATGGVMNLLDKAVSAGIPGAQEQRAALIKLIGERLAK